MGKCEWLLLLIKMLSLSGSTDGLLRFWENEEGKSINDLLTIENCSFHSLEMQLLSHLIYLNLNATIIRISVNFDVAFHQATSTFALDFGIFVIHNDPNDP